LTVSSHETRVSSLSVGLGGIQLARLATDSSVSASVLSTISGLSISAGAGGVYQIEAQLLFACNTAVNTGFGISFPAAAAATGRFWGFTSVGMDMRGTSALLSGTLSGQAIGVHDEAGSNSIIISLGAIGSLTSTFRRVEYQGLIVISTAGSIQMKAFCQGGIVKIRAGSYVRAYKIG